MFVLTHPYPARRAVVRPVWSRAIERLLDDDTRAASAQRPAMDVSETATGYTLHFDLPGMAKEQVNVSVEGRQVSVEAKPAEAATADTASRVVYRERIAPRYARSVTLPVELDAAATTASFADGVLTLNVAKKAVAGPTRITVA